MVKIRCREVKKLVEGHIIGQISNQTVSLVGALIHTLSHPEPAKQSPKSFDLPELQHTGLLSRLCACFTHPLQQHLHAVFSSVGAAAPEPSLGWFLVIWERA